MRIADPELDEVKKTNVPNVIQMDSDNGEEDTSKI